MDRLTKPSEGYFEAKCQIRDLLDREIVVLQTKIKKLRREGRYVDAGAVALEADYVERLRDYVRSVMLWDKSRGI